MQNATSIGRQLGRVILISACCAFTTGVHAQSERRVSRRHTVERVSVAPVVARRVSLPTYACQPRVCGERAGGRTISIPSNARRIDRRVLARTERIDRADHRGVERERGVIRQDRRTRGRIISRNERPASNDGFARAQLRFSHAATFTGNQQRVENAFGRAQRNFHRAATTPSIRHPVRNSRGAHGVIRCGPRRR